MMQIAAAILLLIVLFFALRKDDVVQKVDMPIVEAPSVPTPVQPTQKQQDIQSPDDDENIPKAIVEQAIVPLPRKRSIAPKVCSQQVDDVIEVEQESEPREVIVNHEPKVPKTEAPQMQSPPKPDLSPELPESKPVLAFNQSEEEIPANDAEMSTNKRLIVLNKPKDFLKKIVDTKIKKLTKQEDDNAQLSIPGAIVSTVGIITQTKTSYQKKQTKEAKSISVSIGRFKFRRVKHN